MFMFRSKRTTLTNKLLKARKRRSDEARRTVEDKELVSFLKELKENQLEMLFNAINDKDPSNCVLVPRDQEPHVLCCQNWRWPDVKNSDLRRLPACRSASDTIYICCNPYHWSRLYNKAESPPPPYSLCTMDRLKPEDRAPSEAPLVFRDMFPGSLTTNGEDSTSSSDSWCKLAYWELAARVGRQFPVGLPSVNVFWDIAYGDGLCVKELAQHSFSPPEEVRRVRKKIGLGITLSLEDGSVWVYNRSAYPIFVHSLTLEDDEGTSPTRVPAEHCLCVFDPIKAAHKICTRNVRNQFGPVDFNSVNISFAKGWGPRYSRREITSCPCRIEILLAPCR